MLNPSPGVVVGGRYVLVRPLAKGGMGAVWIARHRDLDVDVALKFMEPSLLANADLRARFEREAKVVARLNSRHIVRVLDYGVDNDMPYLCMELLRGESLADRLAREVRLSVGVAKLILQEICRALRIAHGEGLVHRDLKPGNIFLALEDNVEVVKVLDFGIVKDTRAGETKEAKLETDTGLAMGSVHYMSPEQIRSSRSVDARSDLWSVAIILYKMLTGDVPFPGTAHGDVMVRVCTDPFAPPSFVVAGLPKEMDAFFARALTRDPAGRYQSADELADAFVAAASAISSNEVAPAGPPPRGWKNTIKLARGPYVSRPPTNVEQGSVVQTQPFPPSHRAPDPSFVSPAPEQTAGTFQAVTMPKVDVGVTPSGAAAPRKVSSRLPWAVVGVGGLVTVASAGIVGVLVPRLEAKSAESIAIVPSGPVGSVASPAESVADTHTTVAPMVSAILVEPTPPVNSAQTQPSVPPKTPPRVQGTTTGMGTTPVAPKAQRKNPLDIAN